MSHFVTFVVAKKLEDVETLLAPYDENASGEFHPAGDQQYKWDWWVIGGRWTGELSGYDPTKDPANIELCDTCGGTGKRLPPPNVGPGDIPCNGCQGKGKRVSWILQPHAGDVQKLTHEIYEKIVNDPPFALLTPDGKWYEKGQMGWWGITQDEKDPADWKQAVAKLTEPYTDNGHVVVVVDCHI